MSLYEPTIANLLQALEVVQERERETNGIVVRQSQEIAALVDANTRLETELATLRSKVTM
jgi:transcription elongation factor